MKKFMFLSAGLVLLLLGLRYAVYYGGFYVDFHPHAPIEANIRTEGRKIFLKNRDGVFQPFIIRGVELPSGLPGHFSSDFAVNEETWLRWFGQIRDMGANTIRILTIYDDTFYNAFYRFNKGNERPLRLLQGLEVSDYANHSGQDAYGPEFYPRLRRDAIDAVDVLHGRKNIAPGRMRGSGSYRRDVSPWVLGYVIGNEWNAGTIAYTDQTAGRARPDPAAPRQGSFFFVSKEASAFETMLARIMDDMAAYESKKYKTQKLFSFQSDPENDPFVYETLYARQLGKFNQLDAEHIGTTGALKSGFFASYRLYEFCPDFADCFSPQQKAALQELLPRLNTEFYCQGYTQLLSEYHSIPVVVTGYGFSSSRGTDSAEGPLTEHQQGERLISVFRDIVASGCQGACISSWQDIWERRTWNTSFAVDVRQAAYWHDIQTMGQGYGLLSFDPGKSGSVCYVDGDSSEWTPGDRLLAQGGFALSAKYDESCLYLLIEKQGLDEQTAFFLPLDITPESGSGFCSAPFLRFDRAADFLICIAGRTDSRLLVQARYNALRENYLSQITGSDPFVSFPEPDAPAFVPIRMILKNQKLVSADSTKEQRIAAKLSDVFETGRLVCGNGNPSDKAYSSLSDFCYGENLVELRIPWQLLNFSAPPRMEIHDDYYKNYGVEGFPIKELYLGICAPGQGAPAAMAALPLKGWGEKPVSHERLKKSYDIVKESWCGQDAP